MFGYTLQMVETVRTYTARLLTSDDDALVLWQHHSRVVTAKSIFLDAFLTIRAAVSPADIDRMPEEGRPLGRSLLAAYWLSAERGVDVPTQYVIDWDKRIDCFKHLLQGSGLGEEKIEEWIADTQLVLESALGDGTLIVDRRSAWCDFAKSCGIKTNSVEALEDTLGDIFRAVEPKVKGAAARPRIVDILLAPGEGEDAADGLIVQGRLNGPARSWTSNRFGTGQGADWTKQAKKVEAIATVPLNAGGSILSLFEKWAESLEGEGVSDESIRSVLDALKKPGRKDVLTKKLEELANRTKIDSNESLTEDDVIQLQSELNPDISRLKIGQKGLRPWSDWIARRVDEAGCRAPWDTIGIDGQTEIIAGAAAVLIPQTTNVRKRVAEMLLLYREIEKQRGALTTEAHKLLENYEDKRSQETGGPYRIRLKAIRNRDDVVAEWKGLISSEERIAALRILQGDAEVNHIPIGDNALFEWIASHLEALGGIDTLSEVLRDHVDLGNKTDRLQRLKLPAVCLPDPESHPLWVRFGTNAWKLKYSSARSDLIVFPKVWSATSMEKVNGRIVSARMRRLGEDYPGLPRAARRDRLGRLAVGGSDVASVAAKKDRSSCQLHCETSADVGKGNLPKWYVSISLKLEPAGPALAWREKHGLNQAVKSERRWPKAVELAPGWRVLGVDLGIRADASFAVLHVCDNGEVDNVSRHQGIPIPTSDVLYVEAGEIDYRRIEETKLWARRDGLMSGCVVVGQPSDPSRPAKQRSYHPSKSEKELARLIAERIGESQNRCLSQVEMARDVLWRFKKFAILHASLARLAASLAIHPDAVPLNRLIDRWKKDAEQHQSHPIGKLWNQVSSSSNSDSYASDEILARLHEPDVRGKLADQAKEMWVREDEVLRSLWRAVRAMVLGGTISEIRANIAGFERIPRFRGVRWSSPLDRLNLLYDLYRNGARVFGRPTPLSPLGTELPEDFAKEIRELRENVRSDASKQIASAIVRTALLMKCQGIALEDLSKYRMDEQRGHVENRKLLLWGKAEIAKYVRELCDLHGLALKMVNPWGTSQEAFTRKVKGVRVRSVKGAELYESTTKAAQRWKKQVDTAKRAQAKVQKKNSPLRPIHHATLAVALAIEAGELPLSGEADIFIPDRGGRYLAYPFDADPLEWKVEDADQNAASNIALRALTPFAKSSSLKSEGTERSNKRATKPTKSLRSRLRP